MSKKKREVDGVAALRKMNVEEERIEDYINQMNNLKFKYINFESNSILWIAATINGEKIVYINDNLNRAVDEINIRPEDFRAIARERYQIDLNNLQEMTRRNNIRKIRLTESELKAKIKESIQKVLMELDWRTYQNAADKAEKWRKEHPYQYDRNRGHAFQNAASAAFRKEYGLENQYDNGQYGGEIGTINYNNYDDSRPPEVTGSRDHDFGDGDNHGLRHNVYHMGKRYGEDGGYGRTRMWDSAHETTPEEFYGNEEMGKKFRQAEKDVENFNSGKTKYVKGKGWSNESKINKQLMREGRPFKNNQGYSHFAVSKNSGKIVNGWDYKNYDPSELRQFKKDYFDTDLIDYGFDPKNFRILTYKYLVKNGINPDDNSNWANNDETMAEFMG